MSKTRRRPKRRARKRAGAAEGVSVRGASKEAAGGRASKAKLLSVLLVVVCCAVVAAHWPALSAEALFFDDDLYLTDNVLVQNPGWSSAWRFVREVLEPSTVHGYYQPLTMISLMADYAFGGRADNLMPFHRTSLVLHVCNTALIGVFLYLLFGEVWVAAGLSLLFGVHPMTVETIPWVGERKTLLSAFFALWSLIFYVRSVRKGNFRYYLGCIVTYVLAVLAKPISVPLPVLMLLMDYWPLRRLRWRAVVEKTPFFVLAGVFAVITVISQGRTAAVTMPHKHGPVHIVLTVCHNIVFYPYKMLWPVNMSSYYAFPDQLNFSNGMVAAGVVGTLILIVLVLLSLRWTRAIFTGWMWFFVAIFPTLGVIGFTIVIAADKFAYLPAVGLLMILAWSLSKLWRRSRAGAGRTVIVAVILFLAGVETASTRQHLRYWQDTVGLYERMLALTPDVVPMLYNQARALQAEEKIEDAISNYRRIIEIDPNYVRAHLNIGVALEKQGEVDDAAFHYERALQLNPESAEAHYNMGGVLQKQGKVEEAIGQYRRTLELKPDYSEAHFNLANAFNSQGDLVQAVKHFREAIKYHDQRLKLPGDDEGSRADLAKVHNNLANALSKQGKSDEAIRHFNEALHLKGGYVEAHSNLGWELMRTNRPDAAVQHFREALVLEPQLVQALVGLAQSLTSRQGATIQDAKEAIKPAEKAAELSNYRNMMILDVLASTYAQAGQWNQACTTAEAALALARSSGNEKLTEEIWRKLEVYKRQTGGD